MVWMLDRCDLTTFDLVFSNIVVWGLYVTDYIFTMVNLKLMKELKPKKYLAVEGNPIYKYFIRKYGFMKGGVIGFIFSFMILFVVLIITPFVTAILIGMLLCMDLAIHYPNYKALNNMVKNKRRGKSTRLSLHGI
jgi:hypothetical protein